MGSTTAPPLILEPEGGTGRANEPAPLVDLAAFTGKLITPPAEVVRYGHLIYRMFAHSATVSRVDVVYEGVPTTMHFSTDRDELLRRVEEDKIIPPPA